MIMIQKSIWRQRLNFPMTAEGFVGHLRTFLTEVVVNDYSKDDFCSTKEEYLCVKYLVYK